MSAKLPVLTARKLIAILKRYGFEPTRQSGSHVIVEHPDGRITTVPMHKGKDLAKGTLKKILEDTELQVEDLVRR